VPAARSSGYLAWTQVGRVGRWRQSGFEWCRRFHRRHGQEARTAKASELERIYKLAAKAVSSVAGSLSFGGRWGSFVGQTRTVNSEQAIGWRIALMVLWSARDCRRDDKQPKMAQDFDPRRFSPTAGFRRDNRTTRGLAKPTTFTFPLYRKLRAKVRR
jgi:hypothetical protein